MERDGSFTSDWQARAHERKLSKRSSYGSDRFVMWGGPGVLDRAFPAADFPERSVQGSQYTSEKFSRLMAISDVIPGRMELTAHAGASTATTALMSI